MKGISNGLNKAPETPDNKPSAVSSTQPRIKKLIENIKKPKKWKFAKTEIKNKKLVTKDELEKYIELFNKPKSRLQHKRNEEDKRILAQAFIKYPADSEDKGELVNKIENCVMEVLKEYNIKSFTDKKNIGIWVKNNNNSMKIAAIGIRVKKWIAYHGFAINVSNDLSKYKKIIPCGVRDKGVTNLKMMGVKNISNIEEIIIKKFLNIFL